jgi:DNA-binding CsgD family transcriptional regulator/tetratricopeptide (TPR) repeat protein
VTSPAPANRPKLSVVRATMNDVARLGIGIGLVGRRAELSALGAALARAAEGSPSAVLVAGDAGVGKSRLVTETVARAVGEGFAVLTGRCVDAAAALPYLPFSEVVGQVAAAAPEVLAEHPELRRLLPGPGGAEGAPDRELGQLRVFDAMLAALGALATAAPTLLILEDLHWADRSSRDMLAFLLPRLWGQRLVVVATYRSDDLHRRHPLRPVLSELVRLPAVERLELAPLDEATTLALVGALADGALDEADVRAVARRSEGNAFFAEELVSATAIAGVPHGLADVLLARIEALSPPTQELLRLAAVSGRRVAHATLAAVSGLPEAELEEALREAAAHHVLIADTTCPAEDAYVFRHALLREAIYHDLLPGERTRLHARYAELLAAHGDDPDAAAELAHHAVAAHDLPRALAASVRAARDADRRQAPAEALLHMERALELWSVVPDPEQVAEIGEVELTNWAAWAASSQGDPDRGVALGRRALRLAEEQGDAVLTASVARRLAMRLMDVTGSLEALAAVDRALELQRGSAPSADVAWSHAIRARIHCRIDRWEEARADAETALAITAELDPDAGAGARGDALISLAVCEEYAGRPDLARRYWAEALPLARRAHNLGVDLRARYNIGMSLLDEGRLAEATDELARGSVRAAETGITWSGYGLNLRVAHVVALFLHGEWDAAAEAAGLDGESVSAFVAGRLAAAGLLIEVGRGRFDQAARRAAELRESPPNDEQVVMLLGQSGAEAALWRSEPGVAAERVQAALIRLDQLVPHQMGGIMLAALGIAAQADLVAAGATTTDAAADQARTLAARAEETARSGLPRAGSLGPEGNAWLERARAELTRITGPDPVAWERVAAAFAYETCDGAVGYRGAYARLRRAEALLATGAAHAEVTDDLRAALVPARALGAAPLEAAVHAMAERAGVRLDGTPAPRAITPDTLTPRERSVLVLVADGRTNRQIGAELYISEKTVSVHLSRVMAKLGAGSRTEAVSVAYARGLLTPKVAS